MPSERVPGKARLQPRAWLEEAIGLLRCAERLFHEWDSLAQRHRLDTPTQFRSTEVFDLTHLLKPYLLLSGLALENLLKGSLIGKNPDIGSKEPLNWAVGKGQHDLRTLYIRLGYSPNIPEIDLLDALTEAVQWAGRYPVPKFHRSGAKYSFRIAKPRDGPIFPGELHSSMADFHRQVYSELFKRVFDDYPVPTSPWHFTSHEPQQDVAGNESKEPRLQRLQAPRRAPPKE